MPEIIEWINKTNLDVYCFQEYPKHAIGKMLEKLRNHSFSYAFSPGLTHSQKVYGELTLFDTRKLSAVSSEQIILSKSHDIYITLRNTEGKIRPAVIRNRVLRSALITNFLYQKTPITFINIHLTAHHLNYHRLNQVRTIIPKIKDIPTIVAGDFNYPFGKLVSYMYRHGLYHDTVHMKTHRLFRILPQHLDYVFSKRCRVRNVSVGNIRLSDHYPVYFTVML